MTPPDKLAAGLLLTAAAGFIDAIGFLELGGYFTSFMSGNTTQLGVGLARPTAITPALPLALVFMFFAGGLLGSLLALPRRRRSRALVVAVVLLSIVAALGLLQLGIPVADAMLPLALGAGAQNAILPPVGAARLGTTFVSGTLFAGAQDLARAIRSEAPRFRWLQHVAVWAALCLGAGLGGATDLRFGLLALLAPLVVYTGFLIRFIAERPPPPASS